jgi:hypothetical protein
MASRQHQGNTKATDCTYALISPAHTLSNKNR